MISSLEWVKLYKEKAVATTLQTQEEVFVKEQTKKSAAEVEATRVRTLMRERHEATRERIIRNIERMMHFADGRTCLAIAALEETLAKIDGWTT